MNLGVEDTYVFANLAAGGRLKEYGRVRHPVDKAVVTVHIPLSVE